MIWQPKTQVTCFGFLGPRTEKPVSKVWCQRNRQNGGDWAKINWGTMAQSFTNHGI